MPRLEYTVLDLIESAARNMKAQPLNLGGIAGAGGGAGAPPAGYIGWLPQTRVAYDETEAATLFTPASGMSLLDNLNHIRYRLNTLESGGSIIVFDDNEIIEYPDTSVIHFSGAGVEVIDLGDGEVQIVITATGSGGGGGDFVPYTGATQNVNLGNRDFTVSGISKLGRTQIREGQFLQIGANEFFGDTEVKPTTSYIAFGDSFVSEPGGWVRIKEVHDDAIGITVDGDTGRVFVVGYNEDGNDIETLMGDIDDGYHGYYLKIYSGGAEFNSNVNIPSGFTYNINGIPHTHSGGSSSLTVENFGGGTVVNNVDKITFFGATVSDMGSGDALVVLPFLMVEEADGLPSVGGVQKIIFSGASVTDLGGGDVLVTISGGGVGDSDGLVNRWLEEDLVVPSGYSLVVADYFNTNGFDLTLQGDAALAIINGDPQDNSGWISINSTLTYSSADSPTFVMSTSSDLTALIGVGDRIKLTQTTVKYFIVTAITSSSITVYGGTDYTLVNAAISSVYYSHAKSPKGFPMNPDKWTVEVSDTTQRTRSSTGAVVVNTWYNLHASHTISIPIGCWNVGYNVSAGATNNPASACLTQVTLSTSNNSESDVDFSTFSQFNSVFQGFGPMVKDKMLVLASKTSYYLNIRATSAASDLIMSNDFNKMFIRARCAYL